MKKFERYEIILALYTLLATVFSSRVVGYMIIFSAIQLLGKTELWTWQMWVQIIVVSFGGVILIRSGKKDCS